MKSFNNFSMFFAILMLAVLFSSNQTLLAQDTGVVTVQSKDSFDNTVESLRKMVAQNDMMVLSEINHGKILSMTGLKLNGISLFVGNPTVGKKLFSANKGVGITVPIRVNVYEDNDGKTFVNYVKPSSQLTSFGDEQINMIAKMLDEKLENLTSMLAQ
ncbi:MAG: DUF302 domain-containing protein [Calditrichae bacterium]|nr:DUF302 domain-containing protein [Calditrichia bacterium]